MAAESKKLSGNILLRVCRFCEGRSIVETNGDWGVREWEIIVAPCDLKSTKRIHITFTETTPESIEAAGMDRPLDKS